MTKTNKNKTVLIRMNENCYVTIEGECFSGTHKISKEGNKVIRSWIGAEVWVTPERAEDYTEGDRPMARIIKTRTKEEILADTKEIKDAKDAKDAKEVVSVK